jgi:putative phosphoesterase
MTQIGLLSDTHGYWGEEIELQLKECDEIWHAGDIGTINLLDKMQTIAFTRAVYGNIDGHELRRELPLVQAFEIEGIKVWMTHIAGYPGRYNAAAREEIQGFKPDLVICGHSHILKVVRDKPLNHLHMNPGAAGHHGFHLMRTMLRFVLEQGKIIDLQAVEFGRRGR